MNLREYSASKVGSGWTEEDHIRLVRHLDQIDKTVQGVFDRKPKPLPIQCSAQVTPD